MSTIRRGSASCCGSGIATAGLAAIAVEGPGAADGRPPRRLRPRPARHGVEPARRWKTTCTSNQVHEQPSPARAGVLGLPRGARRAEPRPTIRRWDGAAGHRAAPPHHAFDGSNSSGRAGRAAPQNRPGPPTKKSRTPCRPDQVPGCRTRPMTTGVAPVARLRPAYGQTARELPCSPHSRASGGQPRDGAPGPVWCHLPPAPPARWHKWCIPGRHGLAVPNVRAPPAGPRRSVSGGARALRDLSSAGGQAARRRGSAGIRRAGVPGLPAVRLARRRLRAVPVRVRLRAAGAVLLQGARVLSELLRAADDRARRASGRRGVPGRPRTPLGVESADAPALSAGLGSTTCVAR